MNEQEQKYMELVNAQLADEQLKSQRLTNNYNQLSSFASNGDQNLVSYQLDLEKELDDIYHLLSGHILKVQDGSIIWLEPDDDRLKIFSDYGVKQIMNIIRMYVNRNTLLSNYDEETIRWKVKDFGIELSDLIFNKYEQFFYYPSPEDLYEIYLPIIRKERLNITEKELYYKCTEWSTEELKSKFKHYPMLCLGIIDMVHSAYLRAYKGQERESLRKILSVSQSSNSASMPQPQKQGGILSGWAKK